MMKLKAKSLKAYAMTRFGTAWCRRPFRFPSVCAIDQSAISPFRIDNFQRLEIRTQRIVSNLLTLGEIQGRLGFGNPCFGNGRLPPLEFSRSIPIHSASAGYVAHPVGT